MRFRAPDAPPLRASHLQRLVGDYSAANNLPVARVRHWISTMVVLGALSRGGVDDARSFVVKGGVALEVRLGMVARATKDLDLVFRGDIGEVEEALNQLLAAEYGGFTFRIPVPERVRDMDSFRFEIAISFRGKGWGKLQVEVSGPEGQTVEEVDLVESIDISHFLGSVGSPRHVACLSLRYQIATKLHAVTEQFRDGSQNTRSRDLIDLLLLRELADDLPALATACEEIFALRGKQAWPPKLEPQPVWAATYPREAEEVGFGLGIEEAVGQVRAFIAEIAAAGA